MLCVNGHGIDSPGIGAPGEGDKMRGTVAFDGACQASPAVLATMLAPDVEDSLQFIYCAIAMALRQAWGRND